MIPASREAVFAAWTDPESLKHWMCPGDILGAEAQVDLRVGGGFRITMKSRDRAYEHTGEYHVIEPPPGSCLPGYPAAPSIGRPW